MYYGNISTISNREDWTETVILTDVDSGDLIDISLCNITMTVVAKPPELDRYDRNVFGYGYGNLYCNGTPVLTGSTGTGEITVIDLGTFQWLFDDSRMASLVAGEYQVGVRISQDSRTMQLIIGTVDVYEGIDRQ